MPESRNETGLPRQRVSNDSWSPCLGSFQAGEAVAWRVEEVHDFVKGAQRVNVDETGYRRGVADGKNPKGRKAWLWSAVTEGATAFTMSLSRGRKTARTLLDEAFSGIVGSDRRGACNWIDTLHRPLCQAHLIRDFRRIISVVLLIILTSCASYRSMPLPSEAERPGLVVPEEEVRRISASRIDHLLSRPITFDATNGLSPDEAALLAVITNPSLEAVRDRRGLAVAQVLQAGILPDPRVSASIASPVGGERSDEVPALDLGFEWNVSSLVGRAARIRAARSHANSIDLAIAWREWQVAEAAKLHVYRLILAKKRLALTKTAKGIAQRIYETVDNGIRIGVETADHLSTALAQLQEARSGGLQAQAEVNAERLELHRVLGVSRHQEIRLEENVPWPTVESLPETALLVKDIEQRRLDLLAFRYGYERQEERLRAAIRAQFPKIDLELTAGRDPDGLQTVGSGIRISLPLFDGNQGEIAVARATRRQLFDEYTARLFEARAEVTRISEEIHALLGQLHETHQALQELRRLAERYRKAADRGSLRIVNYYQVLLRLNAKELERLTLRRRLVELAIGLEIASGRYMPVGTRLDLPAIPPAWNSEDTQ